ncbi:hypothetical protein HDE_13199 [Halotydeus destructor]|nr:hypothetical protein HDE_13199 [Halotydeus destructor]
MIQSPLKKHAILAAYEEKNATEVLFVRFGNNGVIHRCKVKSQTSCHVFNSNLSTITAATSYDEDKKIASFFVDELGEEQQAIGPKPISHVGLGSIQNGVGRNPTAIAHHRTVEGLPEFVVFFDEIFTVQVFHMEEKFKMKEPLVVSRSQDYQLSKTWLECRPELCFDSRLDYAFKLSQDLILGRGKYSWAVSDRMKVMEDSFDRGIIDDALVIDGILLVIQNGYVDYAAMQNDSVDQFKNVFRGAHSEDVDAAFEMNGEYVLLSGNYAQVFKLKKSNSTFQFFEFVRNQTTSQLFLGAPSGGFDAVANMDDQLLYLFSNNFYYKYHSSKGLTLVGLMQDNLFACDDSYYKTSNASKELNISSYQDFVVYRTQFMENVRIPLSTETTRPITTRSAGKASTRIFNLFTTSRSTNTFEITVMFLLISIAVFVISLVVAIKLHVAGFESVKRHEHEGSSTQDSLQSVT